MSDPIADFLIRIKNGYMARKKLVEVPWSKVTEKIAKILVTHGYLEKVKIKKNKFKTLKLNLRYKGGQPVFTGIKRVSKPGVRRYVKARKIMPVFDGLGIVIISTPEGLMTGSQAKKKNLGGEIICEVW